MTKERVSTGPIKEKLKEVGVDAILFDFDDTLIDTFELFNSRIQEFFDHIVEGSDLKREELEIRFKQLNNELYEKFGVATNRFDLVVDNLKEENNADVRSLLEAGKTILQKIYTTPPVLVPGAIETLNAIHKENIPMYLVTHANVNWTHFKLDHLNIKAYFENLAIISENGHKTAEEWQKAINKFGLLPQNCLVVGDNVKGDILATHKIGVKHHAWIDMGKGWILYREGDLPESVVTVPGVHELIPAVLSMTQNK